jgi:hypothetical protein
MLRFDLAERSQKPRVARPKGFIMDLERAIVENCIGVGVIDVGWEALDEP